MIDLKAKPFYLSDDDITWVHETLVGMSTEEKAGQLFCVLLKNNSKETMDYVFNLMNPGGFMYRIMPTKNAVEATREVVRRSKVYPLIAANLEKGGNGIVEEGKVYEKGFSYVEMPMGTVHVFLREGYLFPVARGGKCVEDVDFEDLKMYSFGEEIKPYEYYLDDGETKDFTIESHIRMLSC